MTKVLTLTSLYPPHHLGGAELSCHDVMIRLGERGHDVDVLCADTRLPGVVDAEEHGVHRRLRIYLDDGEPRTPPVRQRFAIERHNQAVLAEALDRHRPDVISVWHMGAMSLGLLTTLIERDVPVVYAVCDEWPAYETVLDPWARLWWGSRGRRFAGRVVRAVARVPTVVPDLGASGAFLWVSDLTRRRVEANTVWHYPRQSVIYSGIDTRSFPPLPPVTGAAERPWRWRIVYAGRFDPRKGPDVVIRALAHLPGDAHVGLYGRGGGPERRRLELLAADLGVADRVSFGEVDRPELARVYRDADVVVFPSEWEEPFGLVPVEAMACGTPVVATASGGSAEFLFDDVNCLRIPRRDPAALANAIVRLAHAPDLRRRLVSAGYRTAAQLDAERLTDVIERWHTAAAERYASGEPDAREPLTPAQ